MLASFDNIVSLDALAAGCGLSVSHFSKTFPQHDRPSTQSMADGPKDRAGKYLIEAAEMGFADIAVFCGFSDHAHFSRVFSRVIRRSPTRYWSSRR
jgi:AraC family transcriptional regulator